MYQNYIFDFYGTLADIRTDEEQPFLWQKMSEIYSAMGAVYTAEELKRDFRLLEKKETVALKREYAEPDLRKVFAALYSRKGVLCDTALVVWSAMAFRSLSRKYIRTYAGVKELLRELKAKGRNLYLLSNAQTDFTRPELDILGLTPYFDGILISSEQGCRKPSLEFFNCLLKTFSLKPSECIMIGNDEAADIAGASLAGMDSLYFHTDISPREYGRVPAVYRVLDGDFAKVRSFLLQL